MTRDTRSRLKAVHDLTKSRGWAILRDVMDREIVDAAMAIANNPNMTLDEINFRRGSIWAAKQLLNMPTHLIQKLETDLLIEESKLPLRATDDTMPDDRAGL